jgi:FKBP-type peptidyl-prolyl cis-trans isomerase FkpA
MSGPMARFGILIFVVAVCLFSGCEDLPCNKTVNQDIINAVDKTQLQIDIDSIDAFLAKNNITANVDPTGIRYVVKKAGFGGTPCLENLVSFINKGTFLRTQKEFDSSTGESQLKGLIIGWQIMLPQFPKGTKVTFYIPSGYCYGTEGRKIDATRYAIPPNTNLIFDLELINIR